MRTALGRWSAANAPWRKALRRPLLRSSAGHTRLTLPPPHLPHLHVSVPQPVNDFLYAPPVAPPLVPRRLFHLAGGSIIPVAALFLPAAFVQWGLVWASVLMVALEAARTLVPPVNDALMRYVPLFKARERWSITGATYMVLGAALCFFLFERPVAILALLFLAVGDPAAGLVGVRDHWLRIFGKSLAGTAAFAGAAVAAGALASLHPSILLVWWLVPGAAAAAIAELLPSPLDDNITVPLAAGAAMTLLAMVG